jgi:diguanylate cyclase (GGDEF)-like protein
VHSPTIVIVAAIFSALVTAILLAVASFNKNIPGLRLWTWSYLGTSGFCLTLLLRDRMPEVVSVVLAQGALCTSAYLCWQAGRTYAGRTLLPTRYAVMAIAAVLAVAVFFTSVRPNPNARYMVLCIFVGACFLLTAITMLRGATRYLPARCLFAAMVGFHGLFVLLRPLFFGLVDPAIDKLRYNALLSMLSQVVALEAGIAVVMIAFGTLILTNEFITTELRHQAEVDPLTDVSNRRAFLVQLDKAIAHAKQQRKPLPVIVIDLDHFKSINDTWGHHSGDEVLRHFAALAGRCLREGDVFGRLGGEEFAIFLPNSQADGAALVAERLRALVQATPLQIDGRSIALTASIGVSLSDSSDSAETVLQRADEAMYQAKQRGRNRVEFISKPDAPSSPPTDEPLPAQAATRTRGASQLGGLGS